MKTLHKSIVSLLLFTLVFVFQNNHANCFNCTHIGMDFTPLTGEWISKTDGLGSINATFRISICSPLVPNGASDKCGSGTSVCVMYDNGTVVSAGSFNEETVELPGGHNEDIGESWFAFGGDPCPEDPTYNMTSLINVKCGLTIGSPKFLHHSGCVIYFEWETNAMCKGMKPKVEVQCYLYDGPDRYDLSPLAKLKGGYLVSSELDTEVYINVCRDIAPDATTSDCPESSGACRVKGFGTAAVEAVSLGHPDRNLQRSTDGRLTLKYTSESANTAAGCTSPPTTTIIFICPSRGQSKDPIIVADFDCQYIIEWQTEYACPERTLISHNCQLTMKDSNVDIDLRPLSKISGSSNPYKANYTEGDDHYVYYMNVCERLGIPCPKDTGKVAACQTKTDNSDFGRSMGSMDHMTLSYADGDLLLTYKGGDKCHHNLFQRQTIIDFKCKHDAVNGGIGVPRFDRDGDCIYYFTWETKYACIDHPTDEECRVNHAQHRYDLSSLAKTHDGNWMALHDDSVNHGDFYINVCHNILQEGDASRCDPGAAICFRSTADFTTKNLGRYTDGPFYNALSDNIQIKYKNGDSCGASTITSTITFRCTPGYDQSAPTLLQISNDGCFYDFEWSTAAACALGQYSGDNCKVSGPGFTIDLTPLKKAAGDSYKVDSPTDTHHDYLLNVCAPVTGTKCDQASTANAGICQVPTDASDSTVYNTGQWNQHLLYYDGMINLTYAGGTPYNDDKTTPRRSEIVFLCDLQAGTGSPKYLNESQTRHAYMFEWRTAYACAAPPMECAIQDPSSGEQYDLSSLSMAEGNYAIDGMTDNQVRNKYYINVCRPLNRVDVGIGCSDLASVCRTKFEDNKETVEISDMGHVTYASLYVEAKGKIRLRYEGSNTCMNGTHKIPYVTNIHFICRVDAISVSPEAPIKDGPCEYTIVWNTAAACPLSNDVDSTEACTAKDPNNDYTFNLKPLMKSATDGPYIVKAADTTYKINICGNISVDVCPEASSGVPSAACQVTSDGSKTTLAEAAYKLDFSETGRMTLTYDGLRQNSGQRVNVQVEFLCDPSKDPGEPQFSRKEETTYIFTFPTALACTPLSTDCLVQDSAGKQYDLNTLSRDTYWTAIDTRDDKTKYYINVCRPVNNVPEAHCPNAPIGACQYATNGNSYNMGYIQSKPVANDGSVSIHYRNGDVCHRGKANEAHRSTRINFFCSPSEAGPVFVGESDTCEYVFDWRTPAACPLQSATGGNCKVVEPRYGYQFDLNPLRKASSDYHVQNEDYDYIINVCGPLVEDGHCNKSLGVGACQTKQTGFTPVNAGIGNSALQYKEGELTLTYTGGKPNCHKAYTRKTIIKFTCDLSKDGSDGPIFIEESFNCQYVFEWPTRQACPPYKVGACAITGPDGSDYDLSSLSSIHDNYEYTDTVVSKRYVINVCRSLIRQQDAACPYNAAACEVDLSKPKTDPARYHSVGEPNGQQISFTGGKLMLSYTNGSACGSGKYTTHISFMCDKDAKGSTYGDHFVVNDCDHHFMWRTPAACPLGSTDGGNPGGDTGGDTEISCKVTNPQTGTVFDMSRLQVTGDTPWNVADKDLNKFEFNVCGPLKKSQCGTADDASKMGVCQSSLGSSVTNNAGNAVHDLWYDDGVVVQNLTGGDRCNGGRFQRSTVISFVCNNHKGIGRPVLQGQTDCTYYIAWFTNLVCEYQATKCTVDTPTSTIDLSPLSRNTDEVVASTYKDSSFYLSVCSPLEPKANVMCPPGSGVCQIKSGTVDMQTSLGKPTAPPTYDATTKQVVLRYLNGSVCDVDSSKNFTSSIIFTCLTTPGRSTPEFTSKDGCEFVFHWKVHEVCTDQVTQNKCGYDDLASGETYDFNQLQMATPFEVDDKAGTKYKINLCGAVKSPSSCGTAMVCRTSDGVSFGEPKGYKVSKDSGFLKFTYSSGEKCGAGSNVAESSILFQCDRSAGTGTPEYLTGMGCDIQFLWKTSLVCPTPSNPCRVVGPDSHLYDVSLLSKSIGAWNLTDADGNVYWLGICSAVRGPGIPRGCGDNSGACRRLNSDSSIDSLGSVTGQKKLYLDAQKLILEYDMGGAACHSSRSDINAAKTRINFTCGDTIGAPVFVPRAADDAECTFQFTWKTSLACKVERTSVTAKDGKVTNPRTGTLIDLTNIWKHSFDYTQTLDSGYSNVFTFSLNGSSVKCVDGVICMKEQKSVKTLGTFTSAKYFMDDDKLEGKYSSNQKCTGDQSTKNITSVIQFDCSQSDSDPELLHVYKDCVYIFTWRTKAACQSSIVIVPLGPGGGSSGGPSDGSSAGNSQANTPKKGHVTTGTIVGIVSAFLGAMVLCILLVVFHRKERRDECFVRVRGVLSRRKPSDYTQLPTDGVDDLFGEGDEIITVEDASGGTTNTSANSETQPIVAVAPASYHDDSDEDLLA